MINKRTASRIGAMAAVAALALGMSIGSASANSVANIGPRSPNTSGVKCIQEALNWWGGAGSVSIDGDFGQQTYQAVMDYQAANHLSADGIVGKDTGTSIANAGLFYYWGYCTDIVPTWY